MNKKSRKIFKNLLTLLEKRLNLILLLIFVITFLYAGWVFYNFVYKTILVEPEACFSKIEINKDLLINTVEQLNASEQNLMRIQQKQYQDIFK